MADGTTETNKDGVTLEMPKEGLDARIEREKKYQEALKNQKASAGEGTSHEKEDTSTEDVNKITIDRTYLTSLREEAKDYRKKLETLKEDFSQMQTVLKQNFDVDNPKALAEKLEESKANKEREEEAKLSRVELAEKRAQKLEKEYEEHRIRNEGTVRELTVQRDKIIIQNALIQAAVAYDVANPKQLLRLLETEFYVNEKLEPVYKAEDGELTLDERVKVFLEDSENWNLVRSKIAVGSSSAGAQGGPAKPTFTKAELTKMRAENPTEYKNRQKEIIEAYATGRVR